MSLCVLGCSREARIGLLCWQHHDRLADLLDPRNRGTTFDPERPDDPQVAPSIPVLYAQLSVLRGRHGLSSVSSSAFGSSSPGDDHVLVLRDPRSRSSVAGPDDVEHAPRPPFVVLAALAERVVAERGRPERGWPATVRGVAAWLHAALGWIAARPWVDEAWRELRALSGALRAAGGDPAPAPVGTCRAIVNDAGAEDPVGPWRCAAPLYVPELPPRAPDEPIQLPTLRCPSCGHVYNVFDLMQLARRQQRAAS